jgi:hypothetical protein
VRQLASITRWTSAPLRLYLHTRNGVREPQPGRARPYWVVARELCRFFRIPLLPGASVKQQLDALALQTRRVSVFEVTGSHCHFGADFVSLWLWDQGSVQQAAEAIGVDLARIRVLPETALVQGATDGVRLVETLDGFEGQSWINGSLAASRIWPAPPDDRAWVLFQRGASVPPDRITATTPMALQLEWLDRPWTRSRLSPRLGLAQVNLPLVAACTGAALLIAYGYLGAEWLRIERDIGAIKAQAAAHSNEVEPELKARTTALSNAAAVDSLRQLDKFPTQLALMARVAEIMPANETRFIEWLFDRGKLQLTVAAAHRLDALYFVRALQRLRGFKNVEAERAFDENSLRIRFSIES